MENKFIAGKNCYAHLHFMWKNCAPFSQITTIIYFETCFTFTRTFKIYSPRMHIFCAGVLQRLATHLNNVCDLRFSQYWLSVEIIVLWDIMWHRLADGANVSDPKDGSTIFLPNICIYLLNWTVSHPKAQHSFISLSFHQLLSVQWHIQWLMLMWFKSCLTVHLTNSNTTAHGSYLLGFL